MATGQSIVGKKADSEQKIEKVPHFEYQKEQ